MSLADAADLLEDLRRHDVSVAVDGDQLVLRGRVSKEQVERARAAKPDLLQMLRATSTTEPAAVADPISPTQQPDSRWLAVAARVKRLGAANGVKIDQGSLECAVWLTRAADGEIPLRRGTDPAIAMEWVEAIVQGRATGRLGPEGRPVVRAVPQQRAPEGQGA